MEKNKIYVNDDELLYGFDNALNCGMYVFGILAPKVGFNTKEARRIASLIGGGMGRSATCGCVTGAYMALGYHFSNDNLGEVDKLNHSKEKRAEFNKRFLKEFGSLNCQEMLEGLRNCEPDELDIIMKKRLYEKTCTKAINKACEIVEDILKED